MDMFPQTKQELLKAYPHLRPAQDIKQERFEKYASQNKKIPEAKHFAAKANVRAHLKKLFPGHTFTVKADYGVLKVSWVQYPEELGPSPTQNEVHDALEWFRHWPSDTTCNETTAQEEFRKLFLRVFEGASSIECKPQQPTLQQLARKKQSLLKKVSQKSGKTSKATTTQVKM